MALIETQNLVRTSKRDPKIHSAVNARYIVFESGQKEYIQIETTGSDDRVAAGKPNQVIQFEIEALRNFLDKVADKSSEKKFLITVKDGLPPAIECFPSKAV